MNPFNDYNKEFQCTSDPEPGRNISEDRRLNMEKVIKVDEKKIMHTMVSEVCDKMFEYWHKNDCIRSYTGAGFKDNLVQKLYEDACSLNKKMLEAFQLGLWNISSLKHD